MEWKWKGKNLEEVKEFKYLGYVFRSNGGQEAHIKDRMRKAAIVMKKVWGIGKRKFDRNWERRMWLFDTLVWTVAGYGVEIWGWEERKEMERMQERYMRWTMGVDWRTPRYMVREETKRDKLRIRAGRRAWNFEQKLRKGEGSVIARKCLEEIEGRVERREEQKSKWEEGRIKFKESWGREGRYEEAEAEDRREQEREREERIGQSRYNRWYREVRVEGVPKYLKAGWCEERYKRLARFRLGNEMNEGKYWEVDEERKCRMCGEEEESGACN